MSAQNFNIRNGAGEVLASITFYNYGHNTAQNEAVAVAKLLTDGNWSISRVEPETKASKFIDEFVEVRS